MDRVPGKGLNRMVNLLGDLKDRVPQRHSCVNTWSPVGGAVWIIWDVLLCWRKYVTGDRL